MAMLVITRSYRALFFAPYYQYHCITGIVTDPHDIPMISPLLLTDCRCWAHEAHRVFYDRLVTKEDQHLDTIQSLIAAKDGT